MIQSFLASAWTFITAVAAGLNPFCLATVPGTITAVVAIYSLRSQRKQAQAAASSARESEKEERALRRKWEQLDKKHDQRRAYLLEKKAKVDVFVSRLLQAATVLENMNYAGTVTDEQIAAFKEYQVYLNIETNDLFASVITMGDEIGETIHMLMAAQADVAQVFTRSRSDEDFDRKAAMRSAVAKCLATGAVIRTQLEDLIVNVYDDETSKSAEV